MVWAVARALGWQTRPFPLVTTGGMFEAGDVLRVPMVTALETLGCPAALTGSVFPPEIGAALLAARAAGLPTEPLIEHLPRSVGMR